MSICVQEGGTPDGDVIAVSFNGVFIFKELELSKNPECFDATVIPGQEAVLTIQALSDGQLKPNTVKVTVTQEKKAVTFYVQPTFDKADEIRFMAR